MDLLSSLAWFFMGRCWKLGHIEYAGILAIAAISLAVAAILYTPRNAASLFVAVAVLGWVMSDITWMAADALKDPRFMRLSSRFDYIVMLCVAGAVIFSKNLREAINLLGRKFRRLRIG